MTVPEKNLPESPTSVVESFYESDLPDHTMESCKRNLAKDQPGKDTYGSVVSQQALTRSSILSLGAVVGDLCREFQKVPLDIASSKSSLPSTVTVPAAHFMAEIILCIIQVANAQNLDLHQAVLNKMHLNGIKYPVSLSQGKAAKYTEYSAHTGITKTRGQHTLLKASMDASFRNENFAAQIPDLTQRQADFSEARHWSPYHKPRNLLLAMIGEVGELAELFQVNDHEGSSNSDKILDKVGQELADVTIYLLRLADVCGIELGQQVSLRMQHEQAMAPATALEATLPEGDPAGETSEGLPLHPESSSLSWSKVRSQILRLGVPVGDLCREILSTDIPLDRVDSLHWWQDHPRAAQRVAGRLSRVQEGIRELACLLGTSMGDFTQMRPSSIEAQPGNLGDIILGSLVEYGELAEILQFNGDHDQEVLQDARDKLSKEMVGLFHCVSCLSRACRMSQ